MFEEYPVTTPQAIHYADIFRHEDLGATLDRTPWRSRSGSSRRGLVAQGLVAQGRVAHGLVVATCLPLSRPRAQQTA
jgi:hypothetical protein